MFQLEHLLNPQYYQFNPHAAMPVAVATLNIMMGVYVVCMEYPLYWARTFLYLCVVLGGWFYAYAFLLSAYLPQNIFFAAQLVYLGMIVTSVAIVQLSLVLTNRLKTRRLHLVAMYLIALGMFNLSLKVTASGQSSIPMVLIFISINFAIAWGNLFQYYFKVPMEGKRREIRFWLMGFAIIFLSYLDIGVVARQGIFLGGYIATLGFVVSVANFATRSVSYEAQLLNKELQKEVVKKAEELNRVVNELKTAQVKLMEISKVSAVAALSAGIIHQLSQPTTAIHGFIRFIKQHMKKDDPMFKPVCLIEEQSAYLKDILENLMTVIKHRKIEKKAVDIHPVVEKAMSLLAEEFKLRRIQCRFERTTAPLEILADPLHIQQVCMNIMVNAMDALQHIPEGQRKLLVIRTEADLPNQEVVMTFANNGPIISVEDREQIFEPFFSKKETGAGIGLALCRNLVAEHGGVVYADCVNNQTVFFVRLPRTNA